MGAKYHFITSFRVARDRSEVWSILDDPESWPQWWRWLRLVEILDRGDDDGLGAIIRNAVGTPLGYRLTYDATIRRRIEPALLDFDASGDLVGRGQFLIDQDGEHETTVAFNWLVETPKWWMNLTAPLARPVFSWNHDRLMTDFARGLAARSGGEATQLRNRTLRPRDPGFYVLPDIDD